MNPNSPSGQQKLFLILPYSALCELSHFTVKGKEAEHEDFGEKHDHSPETAEDCGCGNMQFERCPPTAAVLSKYNITVDEYHLIATHLEKVLSFGRCGWCT